MALLKAGLQAVPMIQHKKKRANFCAWPMFDCKVVRLESRGVGQLETGLNLETTRIFYLNVVI